MTDNVVIIDTDKADLVGLIRQLLEKAESGELKTFIGIGLVRVDDNKFGDVLRCQGGVSPDDLFALIGAIETVKIRLCLKDSSVYDTVMELARDCW